MLVVLKMDIIIVNDEVILQIFPERQEDRRIIKSIKFRFPIYYNGEIRKSIEWDSNNTFETLVTLIQKKS